MIEKNKRSLLNYFISYIETNKSFHSKSLQDFARDNKLEHELIDILFPAGIDSIIDEFLVKIQEENYTSLQKYLEEKDFENIQEVKSINQKIRLVLKIYFSCLYQYRSFLQQIAKHYINPAKLVRHFTKSYQISSNTWHLIGDTSTDFNFYTKRLTLFLVQERVMLKMLYSDGGNIPLDKLLIFIDKMIDGVLKFEQIKAKFKSSIADKFNK